MSADATGENISIDTYGIIDGACQPMDIITLVKKTGGPEEFYATFEMDVADDIYAMALLP